MICERMKYLIVFVLIPVLFLSYTATSANAQWGRQPTPNDSLTSVKMLPDNKVKFSIYAPDADKVSLSSSDIPNIQWAAEMNKAENGVWSIVIGPVNPGAYRYNFNVDGISVIDPRNPITSESNTNTWSLMSVSGSDFMDTKEVPHGAVAEITYYSTSLKRFRRMHVYTPPGYEINNKKYPIFYLLHGAMDSDDSWTTVGRAGFILDNLIAAKKAKPMVVVMPAGHTGAFRFGAPGGDSSTPPVDEFILDFHNDIVPYIEKNYRVLTDKKNRAIAGLSMGGGHTLTIAIPNLDKFGYFGVFSSGVFGITGRGGFGADSGPGWEEKHKQELDNAEFKKGLKLVWFATGKEDFLVETSRATVEMLKKHNFDVIYKESEGGHTWINWREYLNEFAPLLFNQLDLRDVRWNEQFHPA